ncbi:hypothetical protein [Alteribacillus bidgolensis]|nr:hypothetical protein [Alteribacillus bidgolensis]
MKKQVLTAVIAAVLLTGCNNNAEIEERFHTYTKENKYKKEDIFS